MNAFLDGHGFYHSGLEAEGKDYKRVFCRPASVELWNALDSMGSGLTIFGPPGVGKSLTVWLWLSYHRSIQSKSVLWVHVSKVATPLGLLLNSSGIQKFCPDATFVSTCTADIVVLDGVIDDDYEMLQFERALWQFDINRKRKAILVASMALKKRNLETFERLNVKRFDMYPWSLEEFKSACRDSQFFDSVKSNLGAKEGASFDDLQRDTLIAEKYYFAGDSARWMFAKTIETVMSEINSYISCVGNISDFLQGRVGDRSRDSVNHLLFRYLINSKTISFFVSKYVAKQIVEIGGKNVINLAYNLAASLNNESFTGWIVELDFLQLLKLGPLSLKDRDGNMIVLESKPTVNFDVTEDGMKNISVHILSSWLIPCKWNQGGYDLACLQKFQGGYLLRFIQITNASSHSLKLQFFSKLSQLIQAQLKIEVGRIEIIMAVPNEKLTSFTMKQTDVVSSGILSHWLCGIGNDKWKQGKEASQVQVLGFEKSRP